MLHFLVVDTVKMKLVTYITLCFCFCLVQLFVFPRLQFLEFFGIL
jgi:hypothetical protein